MIFISFLVAFVALVFDDFGVDLGSILTSFWHQLPFVFAIVVICWEALVFHKYELSTPTLKHYPSKAP